jgi:hypothetical protein
MKKLWLATIGCILAASFLPATAVRAHVATEDNGISALMHIEPNDNPVNGESATYVFTFSDEYSDFDLHDCDCRVLIDGEDVSALNVESPLSGTVVHTIRSAGTHRLELIGKNKDANSSFKPFMLDYHVRVSAEPIDTSFSPYLAAGMAIMVLALLTAALYTERRAQT